MIVLFSYELVQVVVIILKLVWSVSNYSMLRLLYNDIEVCSLFLDMTTCRVTFNTLLKLREGLQTQFGKLFYS